MLAVRRMPARLPPWLGGGAFNTLATISIFSSADMVLDSAP